MKFISQTIYIGKNKGLNKKKKNTCRKLAFCQPPCVEICDPIRTGIKSDRF